MYLPRVLWLSLNTRYGLNIKNLVDAAKKYEMVDSFKSKLTILTYICKNLLRNVEYTDYIKNKSSLINKNFYSKSDKYLNKKSEIHQILIRMQQKCDTEFMIAKNLNLNTIKKEKTNKYHNHIRTSYFEDNTNSKSNSYDAKLIEKNISFLNYFKKFYDNYLTCLYLFVRFVYLISYICQFLFLSNLIGNEFYKIGFNMLLSFYNQNEWPHLKIFPRLTFCEIFIREIGTVHPYLIQCVLRINLFNEVIFIIVWYWLFFLIALSSFDFIWRFLNCLISCSKCERKLFALKYLKLIHMNSNIFYFENLIMKNKQEIRACEKLYNFNNPLSKKSIEIKIREKNKTSQTNKEIKNNITSNEMENYFVNQSSYKSNKYEQRKKQEKERNSKVKNQTKKIYMQYILVDKELNAFENFCHNYFNNDIIFALTLIEKNASSLIVSEIIEYLWIHYKEIYFNTQKFNKNNNQEGK
jgi:hypothetical protein